MLFIEYTAKVANIETKPAIFMQEKVKAWRFASILTECPSWLYDLGKMG
jgi:hypothetical protein